MFRVGGKKITSRVTCLVPVGTLNYAITHELNAQEIWNGNKGFETNTPWLPKKTMILSSQIAELPLPCLIM